MFIRLPICVLNAFFGRARKRVKPYYYPSKRNVCSLNVREKLDLYCGLYVYFRYRASKERVCRCEVVWEVYRHLTTV